MARVTENGILTRVLVQHPIPGNRPLVDRSVMATSSLPYLEGKPVRTLPVRLVSGTMWIGPPLPLYLA